MSSIIRNASAGILRNTSNRFLCLRVIRQDSIQAYSYKFQKNQELYVKAEDFVAARPEIDRLVRDGKLAIVKYPELQERNPLDPFAPLVITSDIAAENCDGTGFGGVEAKLLKAALPPIPSQNDVKGACEGRFKDDGTTNNTNNYDLQWDATDITYEAWVKPQEDGHYSIASVVFLLPPSFVEFAPVAITVSGKCDNGSGDGVNKLQAISIIDTNGVVHDISALLIETNAAVLTTLTITKAQIDALGGTFAGGKPFCLDLKCVGNVGDTISIAEDTCIAKVIS